MIRINLVRPKRYADVSFNRRDLLKIGAKAIETIQKRCARGQNVNDRPMKPLSAKYRQKKAAIGQPPVRNMMFSGSMLGALTVVEASNDRVTVGFTRQAELAKAQKNDQRSPWFGLSKNDEAIVARFAESILSRKQIT